MKTIIFVFLLGIGLCAAAQDRDHRNHDQSNRGNQYQDNRNYQAKANAPRKVEKHFRRDNPEANNTQWQSNGRSWHATYQNRDNRHVDAYYNNKGRMIDQHEAWDRSRMSRDFDDRIYDRYHTRDYQLYRVERPGLSPIYQVVIDLGNGPQIVYVDEYGNIVDYDDYHY